MSLSEEEALRRYGSVPLFFCGYWKYLFEFEGTAPDGAQIRAEFGGNADDIYRFSVNPKQPKTLNEGGYYGASIRHQGKELWRIWNG